MHDLTWYNSYLRPRVAGLDGRIFIVLFFTLLHVSELTLEITGAAALFLVVVELWKGVTPEVALRFIRAAVAGAHRPATMRDQYRRAIDYGYIEGERAKRDRRLI
jgi:hypothetical protein